MVGARPQFIKLAPLIHELKKYEEIEAIILHTGQHYDVKLSSNFFEELDIPNPDYNLEVGSQNAINQMADIMVKMDLIIKEILPSLVIVFGDTNSTAAAAIVAAKNNIKLAHIEAGLREWNKSIPEETNKLITDSLADYYFCPTPTAVEILQKQGIVEGVLLTGDIGMDIIKSYKNEYDTKSEEFLSKYNITSKKYFFVTCHRSSNTDTKYNLSQILEALNGLDAPVIFPIHPRTLKMLNTFGLEKGIGNHIQLIEPIGFIETQILIRHAKIVITDSGGIIKEAYFHKTKSIIIDKQTEWVEIIKEGWSFISGPNAASILNNTFNQNIPTSHSNQLGDGTASNKIVRYLIEKFDNLH